MKTKTIALVGNPNVGKSTVFNALTGMKQHTGNWPGKTVTNAVGEMKYKDTTFKFIDLPGTYSLQSSSPDEMVTGEYIRSGEADMILIIADATCLERNLMLAEEILAAAGNALLCVNLMDEAKKKGISIDIKNLERLLCIPVVATSARSKKGLHALLSALYTSLYKSPGVRSMARSNVKGSRAAGSVSPIAPVSASQIYNQCVKHKTNHPHSFDRRLDRIVTSKALGFPIMFLLLILIFWITMVGANYPSSALSGMFGALEERLRSGMQSLTFSPNVISFLLDGVYTTLTWVVSVMLPPMAIFFPLFTLLEDFGYLPRVAFNLDNAFKKCGAHGKQALTMCMGFGCNACGVMGCRIIESTRERLIAIITNSFVPCNGRFPTLISIILIFFAAGAATGTPGTTADTSIKSAEASDKAALGVSSDASILNGLIAGIILTAFIVLGIIMSLLISKVLSRTLLKGLPSSFVLELPPYRKPKFGSVIVRSIFDRTLFVLGRAVVVAAPAGAIIWLLSNINIGDLSILQHCTEFMDPFGRLIGIDGIIIMAFILGFPANEIVIPIMLMCYMSTGVLTEYSSLAELQQTLVSCGWTGQTALSVLILCLFHFPCGTTCLTIKKETGSLKWTALAFIIPTLTGILICFLINLSAPVFCALF